MKKTRVQQVVTDSCGGNHPYCEMNSKPVLSCLMYDTAGDMVLLYSNVWYNVECRGSEACHTCVSFSTISTLHYEAVDLGNYCFLFASEQCVHHVITFSFSKVTMW